MLKTAEKYCRLLGIPIPDFHIQSVLKRSEYHADLGRNYYGRCHWPAEDEEDPNEKGGYIAIRTRGRTTKQIRKTVAHELIHWSFPKLGHGDRFELYIKALQSGHMMFDGFRKHEYRKKWDIGNTENPLIKYDQLDTGRYTSKETRKSKELDSAKKRLALYQARQRRYANLVKKYERKVKRMSLL